MHMTKEKRKATDANAEIFTPRPVAEYMLDAVETAYGRRLSFRDRILEPGAGDGGFVSLLLDRILGSVSPHDWDNPLLERTLSAFETNPVHAESLRNLVRERLRLAGCPSASVSRLVSAWIREEDFLSADIVEPFDVVIGNPPYVRYDAIGTVKTEAYRRRFTTFQGRCDLYVPFIERSLSLLSPCGVFCFICANRFAKSEYGTRLRKFISSGFHVGLYLNLEHADIFGKNVAAYPAILLVDRKKAEPTLAATVHSVSNDEWPSLRYGSSHRLIQFPSWYEDDEPWMTTDAATLDYASSIRRSLPLLVDSAPQTRFGIGVATGNDSVFVRPGPEPGIEEDCLLPLVTGADVRAGIRWGGNYLVNPFVPDDTGRLRNLEDRPGLARYLERHRALLEKRFVAKGHKWYRTIDRVNWNLFRSPKILLPDIQPGGIVGMDEQGEFYPHHNLYWIVSEGWPLTLLAAILKSDFVTRQIRWSSGEMRGGSIRYQAKNLGLLRIPSYSSISDSEARQLVAAFQNENVVQIDKLVDGIVARCLASTSTYPSPSPEQLLLAMEAGT